MQRTYDRNIPPPLPPHRMLSSRAQELPICVDLTPWAGPVKDQGSEGACTAHADTSSGEWINRRYHPEWGVKLFSPQFTYARELQMQGAFPQDVGSDGETACKTAICDGFCELSLYPYVAGSIVEPSPVQLANASQYRLGAYHGIANSSIAASVLGDPTPWPILVGFTVFSSFEGDELAETGIMPLPLHGEQVLGGHEVLALGYDFAASPRIRPANCPPAFLIQNSWGTSWGLSGRFWMPVQIFDMPDTDLKIVHSGRRW